MKQRRHEQGPGPKQQSGQNNPNLDMRRFKTRICARWENRQCRLGNRCNFAHGPQELRTLKSEKEWDRQADDYDEREQDVGSASGSSWNAWAEAADAASSAMPAIPALSAVPALSAAGAASLLLNAGAAAALDP